MSQILIEEGEKVGSEGWKVEGRKEGKDIGRKGRKGKKRREEGRWGLSDSDRKCDRIESNPIQQSISIS